MTAIKASPVGPWTFAFFDSASLHVLSRYFKDASFLLLVPTPISPDYYFLFPSKEDQTPPLLPFCFIVFFSLLHRRGLSMERPMFFLIHLFVWAPQHSLFVYFHHYPSPQSLIRFTFSFSAAFFPLFLWAFKRICDVLFPPWRFSILAVLRL